MVYFGAEYPSASTVTFTIIYFVLILFHRYTENYGEYPFFRWFGINLIKFPPRKSNSIYDTPYLLDNYCTNLRYNHDTFLIS